MGDTHIYFKGERYAKYRAYGQDKQRALHIAANLRAHGPRSQKARVARDDSGQWAVWWRD